MLKEAQFELDPLEGKCFHGYSLGEEWNGFACPYFTFEQAKLVAKAWKEKGWKADFDEKRDAFVFSVNHSFETGKTEEEDAFESVEIEGRKLYPIGAGCWIWSDAECPENTRAR